jgi:hypothetical protein
MLEEFVLEMFAIEGRPDVLDLLESIYDTSNANKLLVLKGFMLVDDEFRAKIYNSKTFLEQNIESIDSIKINIPKDLECKYFVYNNSKVLGKLLGLDNILEIKKTSKNVFIMNSYLQINSPITKTGDISANLLVNIITDDSNYFEFMSEEISLDKIINA